MGGMCVSSCIYCLFVSVVHPIAILSVVACVICACCFVWVENEVVCLSPCMYFM